MPKGKLILYSADSPRRPGNEPEIGQHDYTINLPLSDGRKLFIHVGEIGFNALRDMLNECFEDERMEGERS
jgi:hypothetical protein